MRSKENSSQGIIATSQTQTYEELKRLLLKEVVSYCDKCGYKFDAENITILHTGYYNIIASFKCPQCGAMNVVVGTIGKGYIRRSEKIPLFGEINEKQFIHYLQKGALTNKEILKVLKTLRKPGVKAGELNTPRE